MALLLLLSTSVTGQYSNINTIGSNVAERFKLPPGYYRMAFPAGSFGGYVQHLRLLPHGTPVHYYNGKIKPNNNIYVAVADLPVGTTDLHQCADAVMHVRADYLYQTGQKNKIKFTFTNGFVADYAQWMAGYRIAVNGNKTHWVKKENAADNDQVYQQYLNIVYTYCGTLSLSKELKKISYTDIEPGDVLIKGGSPGHAEIVLDVAFNKNGQKIFLLAQSYMPAQQLQVLVNPDNGVLSPWYLAEGNYIITPEWNFTASQVMRFPNN